VNRDEELRTAAVQEAVGRLTRQWHAGRWPGGIPRDTFETMPGWGLLSQSLRDDLTDFYCRPRAWKDS
jgi:hypothetical protein